MSPQQLHRENLIGEKEFLLDKLYVASSFFYRLKGLLGTKGLEPNEGLWIHRCNSIHTFFMKFSIDCIFLNENQKVVAIHECIRPYRLVLPVPKARSVIELAAGRAGQLRIKEGDQLNVVT